MTTLNDKTEPEVRAIATLMGAVKEDPNQWLDLIWEKVILSNYAQTSKKLEKLEEDMGILIASIDKSALEKLSKVWSTRAMTELTQKKIERRLGYPIGNE